MFKYLLATIIVCFHFVSAKAQGNKKVEGLVLQCITLCEQGEFKNLPLLFDREVRDYITEEAMADAWKRISRNAGKFIAIDSFKWGTNKAADFAVAFCNFKDAHAVIQFPYSKDHKLMGLFILDKQLKHRETQSEEVAEDKDSFKRLKVMFQNDIDAFISGQFTVPKKGEKFPVAIIVHGSGPQDMDGSIGPNTIYKDLAEGLSRQGIAVLRYDKRTFLYPELFSDSFTLEDEVSNDVRAAINYAKEQPFADTNRIYIIGHSLGAMAAPWIAEHNKVKGIVMMAGPARSLEVLLPEQYDYLAALQGISLQDTNLIAIRNQCKAVTEKRFNMNTPSGELPLGLPPSYWLWLNNYKQLQDASQLTLPILVLNGESDYQVTMKDYKLWEEALGSHKNATLKSYEHLNHLFMKSGKKPGPKDYETASHVEQEVIDDIARWVKKN